MTEASGHGPCPACAAPLRVFGQRLCCDTCTGMLLTLADFAKSVDELIRVEPVLTFHHDKPGDRRCPRCAAAMIRCRLELEILDKRIKPHVELDRCDGHGLWFDGGELAKVYLAIERVFGAHGGGGPGGSGSPGDGPLGSYGKFNLPP